jgi:hypothetical protein
MAPTTIPPIIPAIKPANGGASLATAIPKHNGSATKNTTILAGRSFFKDLNISILLSLTKGKSSFPNLQI